MNAKRIIAVIVVLSVSLLAQSASPDPQTKPKTKKKAAAEATSPTAELANEVHQLRRMMEAQDDKIRRLEQDVRSRDQQIMDLQNAAAQARSSADNAMSSSSQTAQAVSALQSTVADIKVNNTNLAMTVQEEQKKRAANTRSAQSTRARVACSLATAAPLHIPQLLASRSRILPQPEQPEPSRDFSLPRLRVLTPVTLSKAPSDSGTSLIADRRAGYSLGHNTPTWLSTRGGTRRAALVG